MAEVINLVGLERRLDAVVATTHRIEQELSYTNQKVDGMSETLDAVSEELLELKQTFETFVEENRKATALQKAATELIRVRQELEQNFGSYKVVRETMLGVLQATDLALVKKTTISQVTEELMLATPDYWLAPCLVAVSGWIGNDRDLAERAIAEALRRDEEKTALTMALICRRNNRTETCYEWLSLYFAKQSAGNFTKSNFTYLDAYLNGVFGPDEKHMCDDYVNRWLDEMQSSAQNTEQSQVEKWRDYCKDFSVDLEGQFPRLSAGVQEYGNIQEYVSRIHAVDRIADTFYRMQNTEVDQIQMKKNIDQRLVELVSRYDAKEEPLRKEERYLQAVRYFEGDTEQARAAILEAERRDTEDRIDLLSQMTNVIQRPDASASERKTAISFLSRYIRKGYETYITEKKEAFPQQITINVNGWTGVTADGSNRDALLSDYEQFMNYHRQKQVTEAKSKTPTIMLVLSIILALLGIIVMAAVNPALGFVMLIPAIIFFILSFTTRSSAKKKVRQVNSNFDEQTAAGKQQIVDTIGEWCYVKSMVADFENQPMRNVVA